MKPFEINIDLNESSIDEAIKKVEEYKKWLEEKTHQFVEKLADRGIVIANAKFSEALYTGSLEDLKIDKIPTSENGYAVYANGEQVLFIEFGTGIYNADNPMEREEVISGNIVPHGWYGKGYGRYRWWLYEGEPGNVGQEAKNEPGMYWSPGVPAQSCMYFTRRELEEIFSEVAREVFK